MGVTSFKIEGRMKSAQYVSATVSAFQNALSGRPYEKDVLGNIFSRTGFTDGYYTGRIDGKMFGIRREKDKALSQTTSSTTPPIEKTIPIEMDYTISTTECTLIVCDDDGHQAHSSFPPAERALNKPLTPESIEQNLAKTLNTPYRIRHLRGSVADDVFLPIAKINEMRRSALARLSEKRTAFQTYAFYAPDKKTAPPRTLHTPALTASFKNIKQFMPEFLSDLKYASFDLFTLLTVDSSFIASCKDKLVAELPRVYFDDEAKLETALRKLKELGVNKAKCHSPGRMHLAQNAGFDVIGGFGLNLANSEALAQLTQHDPLYLTLSAEMKRSDIAALRYAGKTAIIAYGYFPLMISRNCPIKPETGCSNCPGRLVDRKGVSFPVLCDGDTVEILNSVPLYLADKPAWFSTTDYLDLSFTIETTQECKEILHRYKNHMSTTTLFTRGIYNRGVL
jgi:putative protease